MPVAYFITLVSTAAEYALGVHFPLARLKMVDLTACHAHYDFAFDGIGFRVRRGCAAMAGKFVTS